MSRRGPVWSAGLCALWMTVGCSGDKEPSTPDPGTTETGETADPGTTTVPDDTGDGVHDPLSMPATATLDLDDFSASTTCGDCHPTHYAEWRTSIHASAMVDPVYQRLTAVRQVDLDNTEDPFCTQCHSPIGTRSLDIDAGFAFDDLHATTMEGVNCETCHRVSDVERTHNAGIVIDADGPMRGPITDPVDSPFHDSEGTDLLSQAQFCGACHDVVETSGLPLERPYAEWLTSPAQTEDRPCQTCHMPASEGQAATMGPTDRTLHDHRFVGVDVPKVDGFLTDEEEAVLRADITTLLESSGTVLLSLPDTVVAGETLDVVVTVRNELDAHNLPTGSTFNRQLWLEVLVTDATGRLVFETGTLDDNGDLRDKWSALDPYGDNDLVSFASGFVDSAGTPTLFTHFAAEHTTHALQPLHERTHTLFAPVPADAVGPISVAARLRFRSYGPHLLRLLELDEWLDKLVITDIDADAGEVSLAE